MKKEVSKDKRTLKQVNRIELPAVKPPAKARIKKTKETEVDMENEIKCEEIEEVSLEKYIRNKENPTSDEQELMSRRKTTPLMSQGSNVLQEFAKTKKCRVSRML